MLFVREFHNVATTNELSRNCTCVRTTVNKLLFSERNALAGLYGHTRSDILWGINDVVSFLSSAVLPATTQHHNRWWLVWETHLVEKCM